MKPVQLGQSDLQVTPICLGTMTFGEQVSEADSHAILSHSLARGVNFIDTAEMYSVPPRAETFNLTEKIIGNWIKAHPGVREKLVIATKVAGPSRGMDWVRNGSSNLTGADIIAACEGSLKRMNIEVIDLYQIHWPVRHVPMFGGMYYNPANENVGGSAIEEQLRAMDTLVKAGKVRVLIATDVAARGIDILQLPVVVNYDLPRSATDYTHRIGRTGRAGASGEAVSFVTAVTLAHWQLIQKRARVQLPVEVLEGFEPTEVPPPVSPLNDGTGGIKGKRPSKKDKLRAAMAAVQTDQLASRD